MSNAARPIRRADTEIRHAAGEYHRGTPRKWSDDYILGFVEGVAGHVDLGWFGKVSKHPRVLGILDGASSAQRYTQEKENK